MLRQQSGQCLVWSMALTDFIILTVFQLLVACGEGSVGLTGHDDSISRNRQGVLESPATKDCECVDEIGLN